MRLAARIGELKEAGYAIGKRTKLGKNRYGKPVSYAEYYLEGNDEQCESGRPVGCRH